MRKLLLVLIALIGFSAPAFSQSAPTSIMTNAQATKDIVPYYLWCSSTSVGTTAIELTGNTQVSSTTAGISKLIVQNLSNGATIWFSSDPGVTSSTAPRTGWAVYPITSANQTLSNTMIFPISTSQVFYAIANAASSAFQLCKLR